MASTSMMDPHNRKRTLLKFLLGSPEEQPVLFRKLIYDELDKRKEYMKGFNPEFNEYNLQLSEMIYNSKLNAVEQHTKILKEQMIAHANKEKYPSVISIIERKLYIVELQIDIGIHNLLKNNNVKFYFEV
jgi:hypothetical protein